MFAGCSGAEESLGCTTFDQDLLLRDGGSTPLAPFSTPPLAIASRGRGKGEIESKDSHTEEEENSSIFPQTLENRIISCIPYIRLSLVAKGIYAQNKFKFLDCNRLT